MVTIIRIRCSDVNIDFFFNPDIEF